MAHVMAQAPRAFPSRRDNLTWARAGERGCSGPGAPSGVGEEVGRALRERVAQWRRSGHRQSPAQKEHP